MATDIKISELNEVSCNNDLNHIIINDRENAGDEGITKKIKLENFLTKDIVKENNIINSAVTNSKIAPNTINCSRIANKTITCNQIANDTINNAVLGGNSVDQRVLDSNAHFTIKDLTVCAGCVNISGSGTSCLEVATGITKLSTIRYYWPTTQNGGDKFLKTDGSGNLSWDEAVPGESTALVFAEIMPVGTIIPWGGQTDVPSDKWLICDGSTFNGTQYPDLSAALGDTWGTRSGNNFYRPDLRGRVPLGAGSSTPDANGNQRSFSYTTNGTGSHYGGAFDHCLTVPQLACHTHSFNTSNAQYGAVNEPVNQNVNYLVGQCRATALYNANAAINNQPYINGTGSGSGHNNIQPYTITRYIIKAKPDDIQQFNPLLGPGLSAKDVNSQTSTMTLTSTEIGVKIDNDTLKFDGSNNITLNPVITATSVQFSDGTLQDTYQSTPFYTVEIADANNYTQPSQFVGNAMSTHDEYSKGTIKHPYNSNYWSSTASLLYTMNVKVLSNTTVTLYNYSNDDYFYVYVDGTLEFTGANYASFTPRAVTLNLTTGNRKIEIVKNDSGNGSNRFELLGNIIGTNVLFLSGK